MAGPGSGRRLSGMTLPHAIHVSPLGDDAADGTVDHPLRTPAEAVRRARPFAGRRAVTVWFADGTYPLAEPLRLGASDSGSPACPVVYAAMPGAEPVFSGAQPWLAGWSSQADGCWQAPLPEGGCPGLVVAGRSMPLASYPKRGWADDVLAPERVARWRDPVGATLHALHMALWGGMHYRITGRDPAGGLTWEGGWQNNRPSEPNRYWMRIEGVVEELTEAGEWCIDRVAKRILHRPAPGVDLRTATSAVVRLRHLIEFEGASHIEVRGLRLRHAAPTFMDAREPLLRSDWRIYRGGAVVFRRAMACILADCVIEDCAGNGVILDGWNREVAVRGCLLRDLGASGVVTVGAAGCVRSPLSEYGQHQDPATCDRTPGPANEEFPECCLIEDCLIQRTGLIEKQSAGVQISMSRRITVRQCTVHDVPRAGININEGSFGGHLIEGCDVFATVLETGDHGAFNAWGRDRFWDANPALMQAWVDADPALPWLDAALPTVLRRNRWRCDHGWDIDLDDGAGNYLIEDNVCLAGGLKLREGYGRTVSNNLMVGCTLHAHLWPMGNGDVVQRNIVTMPYAKGIGMPAVWGASWDGNLLPDAAALAASRAGGHDRRSVAGDPGFVDAPGGDLRLCADSPAWALGWHAIPMDDFGVRSSRLRALAGRVDLRRTLVIDTASTLAEEFIWLGARVRAVTTLGEVSAAGLSQVGGFMILEVPAGTPAARYGLIAQDVIIGVEGFRWPDQAFLLAKQRPEWLGVRRWQEDLRFECDAAPI